MSFYMHPTSLIHKRDIWSDKVTGKFHDTDYTTLQRYVQCQHLQQNNQLLYSIIELWLMFLPAYKSMFLAKLIQLVLVIWILFQITLQTLPQIY